MHDRLLSPYAAHDRRPRDGAVGQARRQALVGVDGRVADRGERRRVAQDPGDEASTRPCSNRGRARRRDRGTRSRRDSTSARLMLKCAPDPHEPVYGFGMNVANRPCCFAICFASNRNSVSRSAISSAGAYSKSNSYWPSPPSASKLNTPKPVSCMAFTIGSRNADRVDRRLDVVGLGRAQASRARPGREVAARDHRSTTRARCRARSRRRGSSCNPRLGGRLDLALQDANVCTARTTRGPPKSRSAAIHAEAAVPRQHRERFRIGHRDALVFVRRHHAEIAHAARRVALVTGEQLRQVRDRERTSTSSDRSRRSSRRRRTRRPGRRDRSRALRGARPTG